MYTYYVRVTVIRALPFVVPFQTFPCDIIYKGKVSEFLYISNIKY